MRRMSIKRMNTTIQNLRQPSLDPVSDFADACTRTELFLKASGIFFCRLPADSHSKCAQYNFSNWWCSFVEASLWWGGKQRSIIDKHLCCFFCMALELQTDPSMSSWFRSQWRRSQKSARQIPSLLIVWLWRLTKWFSKNSSVRNNLLQYWWYMS